jgi:hypothetical protein
VTITRRRSRRSASAPAGRLNSSQGRRSETPISADEEGAVGEGARHPREGDEGDAVADVGECAGAPKPPEVPAQAPALTHPSTLPDAVWTMG